MLELCFSVRSFPWFSGRGERNNLSFATDLITTSFLLQYRPQKFLRKLYTDHGCLNILMPKKLLYLVDIVRLHEHSDGIGCLRLWNVFQGSTLASIATFLSICENLVDGDPSDAGFFPLFFQRAPIDKIGWICPRPTIDSPEQY